MQHFKAIGIFKLELEPGNAQFGSKLAIFLSRVTLKIIGWPWETIGHLFYLYYIKLCAAFQSHWYIHTGVTVQKRSIRVKIGDSLSCVSLKINGWPWKTIGHLFYIYYISFGQNFKAIGISKLELQSGNAQFGSKWEIFCPVWPWNLKMDDIEKRKGTSSILH